MKDLLKEIVASGKLDTYSGDETHLPALLGGIHLLRKGAFSAAMRVLGTVSRWGVDEVGLMRGFVPLDRLLNGAAEEQHGSFGEPFGGNLGFFCCAVLGDAAGKVQDFYRSSNEFITRVVGVRHNGRLDRLEDVSEKDVVSLVWEKNNPYDANAILVLNTQGDDLGYLRRGIAHQLVQRLKKGASLSGHVAALLGEATLSRRERPGDPRVLVPRERWTLHVVEVDSPNPTQLPRLELEVVDGLSPGWIYELIYTAQDPLVMGVG
ncbi:MAG: HIRAN domain-containing protein, partial [Dehalococcoidia bacterium]|nr:HIRAN domain-containing protein [Dehalococcoidia bacterium]